MKFNIEEVKARANGRWIDIFSTISGVNQDALDGQHHPCPKCGGTDRFRMTNQEEGVLRCNQCFTENTGNGILGLAWLNGEDFKTALGKVADHLGIEPEKRKRGRPKGSKAKQPSTGQPMNGQQKSDQGKGSAKPVKDPAAELEWKDWDRSRLLIKLWCKAKQPITPESIEFIGGRVARFRKRYTVIAIPVWGKELGSADPVGWVLYQLNGKPFPMGEGNPPAKTRLTNGSRKGIIGNLADITNETRRLFKLEGPTDLMAFHAKGPAGSSAMTTANGASEKPEPWMVKLFTGRRAVVLHDRDEAGYAGSKRWGGAIANETKDVVIAAPTEEGHDLRDHFNAERSFEEIEQQIKIAEPCEPTIIEAEGEAATDPSRLAELNLEEYERKHGGRLVFWKSQWWRWKDGRYRDIDNDELAAKVWPIIRREFLREYETREPDASGFKKPAYAVSKNLVANTIAAMASLCIRSSSYPMPCLIPEEPGEPATIPNYISAKNGIIDLEALFNEDNEDQILLPHTPNWFSTFQLGYSYEPDADCPIWLNFLHSAMEGDADRIAILQEWAGYLLTVDSSLQRFIALEGEGGNGKTVYCAGIAAMLGRENVSRVNLEKFGGRFDLASTLGKMVNICGDVGEIDRPAEGDLKLFTGGEEMTFDRKGISPIVAKPTAKLMVCWNGRPKFRDRSQGLWRRLLLVPFNHTPRRREITRGMDGDKYWIENGQAPGILLWAIEGLRRLREQGEFTRSETSEGAVEDYKNEANPTREFLLDYLMPAEEGEEDRISKQKLYDLYRHHCEKTGHKYPQASRSFGREVARLFPDMTLNAKKRIDGRRVNAYGGVQFVADIDDQATVEQIFNKINSEEDEF